MKVRAISPTTGDWTFGNGTGNYLSGQAATAQLIRTRILSFLGNCFFDAGAGINWFGFLGGKDQAGLQLAITMVIINTPDQDGNQLVTGAPVVSVSLNDATRVFSISYTVQTIYSTITGQFTYDVGGIS